MHYTVANVSSAGGARGSVSRATQRVDPPRGCAHTTIYAHASGGSGPWRWPWGTVRLYIARPLALPVSMTTVTVTVTRSSTTAPWGMILAEAPLGLVIQRCVPGSPAAQSLVPLGLVVGLGSRRPPVPATVADFRSATASLTTLKLKVYSSAPKLKPVPESASPRGSRCT